MYWWAASRWPFSEREKRGEGKERERREKGGGEEEKQTCYGCKTPPWNCQKIIKDTETGEAGKWRKKRQKGQRKRWQRKDLRCENSCRICILFKYETIPSQTSLCQFYSSCLKKGYRLNRGPFFFAEYSRKVCIKPHKLSLKIARFL